MMRRAILLFSGFGLLLGALSLPACSEEAADSQDRTQELADSLARADSLEMVKDSLERARQLEKMNN